jgi:hypothetical protein
MSRTRFEEIMAKIRLTDKEYPPYSDKFFDVRQMIDAWNDNMKDNFVPSWISCLDESMCAWTSKWSCPGWMVVPRKPHPFGNEYHSICCGLSGIMYFIELVEGKTRPRELGPLPHSNFGKTAGLLLRMTQTIHGTGKVVIMDSGFCVLDGLPQLKRVGVYCSALIEKRKFWPKHVDGDKLAEHFHNKAVGTADARLGVKDGRSFYIYAMKEPDYTMMMMATNGNMQEVPEGNAKRTYQNGDQTTTTTFKYTTPFYNHFSSSDIKSMTTTQRDTHQYRSKIVWEHGVGTFGNSASFWR